MGVVDVIWARENLVVITKVFFGSKGWFEGGPNDQGLSRKHIVEGTKTNGARHELCDRPGLGLLLGHKLVVIEACDITDRLGLVRPIVEQPEYNLMERRKVEIEYEPLYTKHGLGLTTWSPLSFAAMPEFDDRAATADKLKPIADELGVTLAQLAITWCLSNDKVSTVIVGASRPSQLKENIKTLGVVEKLTPEGKQKIEALVPLQAKEIRPDALSMVRARHLQFG
ncbi:hypothetical protein BBJ29_007739 [Phytophthora kernoviae]|nr:hypothetical protein BBJ29_007739 [Phytophthora kernoviae]